MTVVGPFQLTILFYSIHSIINLDYLLQLTPLLPDQRSFQTQGVSPCVSSKLSRWNHIPVRTVTQ